MATVAILTSSTLGTFYSKALRRTVVPHLHREVRGSQQRRYCREVHVVRFTHDPFDDRHRSRLKLVHHHMSYPIEGVLGVEQDKYGTNLLRRESQVGSGRCSQPAHG